MTENQTVKLVLACANCGNTTFIQVEDGFKCSSCGDFSYPEDMGTEVVEE